MAYWPEPVEYSEAVQTPRANFTDPELRAAAAEMGMLGPVVNSGNFASVYHLMSADGRRSWAVKCFTRSVAGRRERYRRISEHLQGADLSCAVHFQYQDMGIRVGSEWFPILKMEWVDGLTLSEFVAQNVENRHYFRQLSTIWQHLEPYLRSTRTVHGDLQHGNVMLVPEQTQGRFALRLIDYDGLWTPDLADSPSGESGHSAYQHPDREQYQVYSPAMDRFPHLVIAAALKCLTLPEGPTWWKTYSNADNLLFTKRDFQAPGQSPLLHEMWDTGDSEMRAWAGMIARAAASPMEATPLLQKRLVAGRLARMNGEEESAAREVLCIPPDKHVRKRAGPGDSIAMPTSIDLDASSPLESATESIAPARTIVTPVAPPVPRQSRPNWRLIISVLLILGCAWGGLELWRRHFHGFPRALIEPVLLHDETSPEPPAETTRQKPDMFAAMTIPDMARLENSDFLTLQTGVRTTDEPRETETADPAAVVVPRESKKITEDHLTGIAGGEDSWVELRRLEGHAQPTSMVAFSPAGQLLAPASEDHTVRIWNWNTGRVVHKLAGHSAGVLHLAYSPDAKRLASSSRDQTMILWGAAKGKKQTHVKYIASVNATVFSQNGTTLATAVDDGMVWLHGTRETLTDKMRRFQMSCPQAVALAFSPDGAILVCGGGRWSKSKTSESGGELKAWDVATGNLKWSAQGKLGGVWGVAFDPNRETVAGACLDGTVRLWEAADGKERVVLKGHTDRVMGVAYTPTGKTLASSSLDGTVRLWNPTTSREKGILNGKHGPLQGIAISRGGTVMATAGFDGAVTIWKRAVENPHLGKDVQAALPAAKLSQMELAYVTHGGHIVCRRFSDGGQRLISCSQGKPEWIQWSGRDHWLLALVGRKLLRLADRETDQEETIWTFDSDLKDLSVSEDEQRVAWLPVKKGESVPHVIVRGFQNQPRHDLGAGYDPAWSSDGKSLAFVTVDKGWKIAFWDGMSVREIAPPIESNGGVFPAASVDGRIVAYGARASDGSHQIALVSTDGIQLRQVTRNNRLNDKPVFSPDGRYVAYVRKGPKVPELAYVDLETDKEVVIAENAADMRPAWRRVPD